MNGQNLKKLVESEGAQAVEMTLRELAEEKKLRLGEQVSIPELWDAFVGRESLDFSHRRGFVEKSLSEAAVNSTHFNNITGVLLGNLIIEAYEMQSGLADMLVDTYKSKFRDERIPGFGSVDIMDTVNEGDAYPSKGFFDKYVTTGTAEKRGGLIDITEETITYDQTGQIANRAKMIGERIAQDREEKILSAVTGVTTCYYPSGTGTALYGGTPYLKASNALVDWTSIEAAITDGLAAMTDETGKSIIVKPTAILVPTALDFTARRIINATQILTKNPTTGTAGTTAQARETWGPNPVPNLQILSSPLVAEVSSSTTTWWIGDFKRQFKWKEVWPIQVFSRQANSDTQYERDLVAGYKVRYLGNVFAVDQKHVVKCTA